ncbi:MAG: hypothetical protein FWH57_02675 [Oscillospiraceae bacterium]|nr:hypothetical protein [Oscillospiraceae bacterium]
MFDNINPETNNSEINLNLKMPQEQTDSSFSFRDFVLTIYSAKKVFLVWCCIGLILGIAAAGGFFLMKRSNTSAEVSVALILNYSKVSENIFPSGEEFDIDSFYSMDIWANALKAIGRDDVAVADAMNQVRIAHMRRDDGTNTDAGMNTDGSTENTYSLTLSDNSSVFMSTKEKEDFLQAFCSEYNNYIVARYYIEDRTGMLHGQQLKEWIDVTKAEIIWDSFSFSANYDLLGDRYIALSETLSSLYDEDPAFRTADGKSFDDYAKEFEGIVISELPRWRAKLDSGIYIRNIDRFKQDCGIVARSMRINRQYHLDLLASYNEMLLSFQQKDAEGVRIDEAVEILMAAQESAEIAADLQRQIGQLEYYYEMLGRYEQDIRASSEEAEIALTAFITGLENNQAKLQNIILDYYKQTNERDAENSILYTNPTTTTTSSISMVMVFAIFIAITLVGAAIGIIAAVVKKYLPQ